MVFCSVLTGTPVHLARCPTRECRVSGEQNICRLVRVFFRNPRVNTSIQFYLLIDINLMYFELKLQERKIYTKGIKLQSKPTNESKWNKHLELRMQNSLCKKVNQISSGDFHFSCTKITLLCTHTIVRKHLIQRWDSFSKYVTIVVDNTKNVMYGNSSHVWHFTLSLEKKVK